MIRIKNIDSSQHIHVMFANFSSVGFSKLKGSPEKNALLSTIKYQADAVGIFRKDDNTAASTGQSKVLSFVKARAFNSCRYNLFKIKTVTY